ncbi:MAG TPA: hypothetical protein VFP34_04195 [Microlunatus sp.]|nr:hypothetical protein [Microlunatus sp.]
MNGSSLPPTRFRRPAHAEAKGAAGWRLTERGIAVVVVTAAMLAVAAIAVVVPTALRVTGDNYQPLHTSQLVQP